VHPSKLLQDQIGETVNARKVCKQLIINILIMSLQPVRLLGSFCFSPVSENKCSGPARLLGA
jgi:hypothetical protein